MSKITLATIKSFVKKNHSNLYIKVKSHFDAMTDGCERLNGGFIPVSPSELNHPKHTMGIQGAWFVGHSSDYFRPIKEEGFSGYEISNSCGHFILAVLDNPKTTARDNFPEDRWEASIWTD
jgi:hypothetical protein